MPGGNGSVLLARSLHIAPETTRILFTGYADISAVIEAVNEGQVYHYLAKPWQPEELRAVVEQGVERYRLVTENRRLLDELQKANRDLEAANRELNEFVSWVAHDLRSPLRALDGFSLILCDDYADRLDETALRHLARIRAASQRLDELFDAQIALAEAGRRPIVLEEVDVTAAARRVAGELLRAEPGRVVELVVADGLHMTTDADLLDLVLHHLLGNAWKFTAKTASARIEVGMLPGRGAAVFFVRDNGAGFDAAYADKLFVPFERLHPRDEFAGEGIGLTIVRRALERLGGRYWAEGEVGRGATFFFALEWKGET
jgi:light-regulated signal transduction histidine kinase (bacteriophytochrome)